MFVSIIIINYDTFKITCDCIASVIRNTQGVAYEIILVDNASPNDNPDEFLKLFPSITLIKSPENGGFAKGNNIGIRKAKGDILLLLNSDTLLTSDSITIAAEKLISLPDVGALTVRLTYPDGRLQHTARRFRSIKNELLDILRPFLKLMPYRKRSSLMLNQYFNGDYNTYADWVSGAFMMMPASMIVKLPEQKLDERFFMYGEDQLWCLQFSYLGYKSYYDSDKSVIHINSASTSREKQIKLLKKLINLELEIMKYRKGKTLYFYIFAFIFSIKEWSRYYIKIAAQKILGISIR